jgi:hypothetical protein
MLMRNKIFFFAFILLLSTTGKTINAQQTGVVPKQD